ncbi:hypothetical protein [Shewanella sp.]|uniref:hypothetical protein n=1 Tax=Shewanella sp. TaxID=50422 RepID=UPI003A97F136
MKLYPYSRVTTTKLGSLLFAARAFTVLAYLVLLATVGGLIWLFVVTNAEPRGFGPSVGALALAIAPWGFCAGILLLVVGGISAAFVAIEDNLAKPQA